MKSKVLATVTATSTATQNLGMTMVTDTSTEMDTTITQSFILIKIYRYMCSILCFSYHNFDQWHQHWVSPDSEIWFFANLCQLYHSCANIYKLYECDGDDDIWEHRDTRGEFCCPHCHYHHNRCHHHPICANYCCEQHWAQRLWPQCTAWQWITKSAVILVGLLYMALVRKKKRKDMGGPTRHQAMRLTQDIWKQYIRSTTTLRNWKYSIQSFRAWSDTNALIRCM